MVTTPVRSETKYARSGDVHIAYQVIGDGPIDLVFVPGWVSHVELSWEVSVYASFLIKLASFSRLIIFDKRGTGLSDRVGLRNLPTLEERAEDLLVVMDAVGSEKAAVFGFSEGGNMSAYFAASHPERTIALVMFGTFAKRIWAPDYPWAPKPEDREREIVGVERDWGGGLDLEKYMPSMMHDQSFLESMATYLRRSASPGAAVALLRMNTQIDISGILPTIRSPSLVLHRTGDRDANIEEGRWIADKIPGSQFVELPGEDHFPYVGDQDAVVDHVQEFLTGELPKKPVTRVLASILFTDIVSSTKAAGEMGDAAWRELLNRHDQMCRSTIDRFQGENVKSTGDGILATFDGPGRAVSCAKIIIDEGKKMGIEIRAGVHVGEVELRDDEIAGVAVHLCARVSGQAGGGEVLVSRTVRDLVAGSDHKFAARGDFALKGFDEKWALYALD